jgi:hypothetical protein
MVRRLIPQPYVRDQKAVRRCLLTTRQDGTALRAAEDSPDGIVLTVQDDGVGVAADDLPKLFDAFFTTRGTVGTGPARSTSCIRWRRCLMDTSFGIQHSIPNSTNVCPAALAA